MVVSWLWWYRVMVGAGYGGGSTAVKLIILVREVIYVRNVRCNF